MRMKTGNVNKVNRGKKEVTRGVSYKRFAGKKKTAKRNKGSKKMGKNNELEVRCKINGVIV